MNQEPIKILLVDNDQVLCGKLQEQFKKYGYEVICASDPETAMRHFATGGIAETNRIRGVILDLWMPWRGGEKNAGHDMLALIKHFRLIAPRCPVIVHTGHGTIQDCVKAIKAGAADFIEKGDFDELLNKCAELLGTTETAPRTETETSRAVQLQWLKQNYRWMRQKYPGKFAAIVPLDSAKKASVPIREENVRDRFILLVADSYEEIFTIITNNPDLYCQFPAIHQLSPVED